MLMSKAQIFEKAVQKISLNRLIHRKTWDTTENSLEKARISAKTRWENVQGRKTGRSCNSYTMLRVFFTRVYKKWVRLHYVGIPICDDQTKQRSHRRFVLSTVSSCQTVRMAYTDNCTIDSSIINDFRTIHILTKKSRFTKVVRLLFFVANERKRCKTMAKPWTSEELAILNQRYPKEGASDALVKTLNRTKQAIHFKAQQVGLRNANRKRFTDKDVEILRARYPNEGASKDLQKLLGRSAATINRKARLLGIVGARHYWTEEELKILAERYPKEGASQELMQLFQHSAYLISMKANALGLRYENRRRWTEEEENILIERYPWEGASEALLKDLNRSRASVLNHTSIMGLVYQKRSMWTADEEKVLRERFPEEGASESLQKTLNRTSTAIYCKAMRLGCQKPAQKNRK